MNYDYWTTTELKLVTLGIIPETRSMRNGRVYCKRHGIPFPGKRACDANERLIKELDQRYSTKGHTMAKSKPKTVTASVKDAKAVKKPAAAKAAKTTPEPEKAEERAYSFRTINIDNIIDMGDNIREVKNIDELMESIKAHGIINPITVANDFGMATNYRVIAGFRRLAAKASTKSRFPKTSPAWT